MPPSGSLSKSAAPQKAGARTAMAFVVSVALVVLTILFLTGLFVNLPEAALAAIVIHAVMGMIQPLKIWGLRQIRVPDFWLALFAFLGVLLIGVMAGIVIGVVAVGGLISAIAQKAEPAECTQSAVDAAAKAKTQAVILHVRILRNLPCLR